MRRYGLGILAVVSLLIAAVAGMGYFGLGQIVRTAGSPERTAQAVCVGQGTIILTFISWDVNAVHNETGYKLIWDRGAMPLSVYESLWGFKNYGRQYVSSDGSNAQLAMISYPDLARKDALIGRAA